MTSSDLIDHLKLHYAYEIDMARHTAARVESEGEQLSWNAFFESFWIHARQLRDFFTNDKAGNNRNIVASTYGAGKVATKLEHQGQFNRIDEQIAHLTKNRVLADDQRRLTIEDVREIAKWIEEKHAAFLSQCDEDVRNAWGGVATVELAPLRASSLSATNNIQIVQATVPTIGISSSGPQGGARTK